MDSLVDNWTFGKNIDDLKKVCSVLEIGIHDLIFGISDPHGGKSFAFEKTVASWMKFDTCALMKSQDLISWRIACDEYIDELEPDEQIISFDSSLTYYWVHDLDSRTRTRTLK